MTTRLALNHAQSSLAVCRAAIQPLPADPGLPASFQVIPAGRSVGEDGRVFVLSDAAAVVARFRADLPIDVEHSTHIKAPLGEPAPAVGWVKGLKVVDGGIVAEVAWNSAGRDLVEGQAYRFISPAFLYDAAGNILELKSVGLTNSPNFKDLPALNRQENPMDRTKLIAILGLKADATDADIEAALNAQVALNRQQQAPDLKLYVPRADYELAMNRASTAEADLKKLNAATAEAEYVALVDQAVKDGKAAPASRDHYLGLCRAGQASVVKALFASNPVIPATQPSVTTGDPSKDQPGTLDDAQLAICRRLGLSPEAYLAAGKA